MTDSMETVVRYTTAPEAYDGFGTTTEDARASVSTSQNPKPLRKVKIKVRHLRWQECRYGSGLHVSLDQANFDEWLQYGFVKMADAETKRA